MWDSFQMACVQIYNKMFKAITTLLPWPFICNFLSKSRAFAFTINKVWVSLDSSPQTWLWPCKEWEQRLTLHKANELHTRLTLPMLAFHCRKIEILKIFAPNSRVASRITKINIYTLFAVFLKIHYSCWIQLWQ